MLTVDAPRTQYDCVYACAVRVTLFEGICYPGLRKTMQSIATITMCLNRPIRSSRI